MDSFQPSALHAAVLFKEILQGHPETFLLEDGLGHAAVTHFFGHRLGQLLETQRVVRVLGNAALLAHHYLSGGPVHRSLHEADAHCRLRIIYRRSFPKTGRTRHPR